MTLMKLRLVPQPSAQEVVVALAELQGEEEEEEQEVMKRSTPVQVANQASVNVSSCA